MTEQHSDQAQLQPAPEDNWSQDQYFERVPDTQSMLAYGSDPNATEGVKRVVVGTDYEAPVPASVSEPMQPTETASNHEAYQESDVERRQTPEEMRALRAQVVLDSGQAAVAAELPDDTSAPNKAHDVDFTRKARAEADMKYQQVRVLGGTHEEAEAAANRIWKRYGLQ